MLLQSQTDKLGAVRSQGNFQGALAEALPVKIQIEQALDLAVRSKPVYVGAQDIEMDFAVFIRIAFKGIDGQRIKLVGEEMDGSKNYHVVPPPLQLFIQFARCSRHGVDTDFRRHALARQGFDYQIENAFAISRGFCQRLDYISRLRCSPGSALQGVFQSWSI